MQRVSEVAFHTHCLVVAEQHVQSPAPTLGLPLKHLQEQKHVKLIVAAIQLVSHLNSNSVPSNPSIIAVG
jgi:hypothetical protein